MYVWRLSSLDLQLMGNSQTIFTGEGSHEHGSVPVLEEVKWIMQILPIVGSSKSGKAAEQEATYSKFCTKQKPVRDDEISFYNKMI